MSLYQLVGRADFASNNVKEHVKARMRATFHINDSKVLEDEVVIEYDNQYSFPSHLSPSGELAAYGITGPNYLSPYLFTGSDIEPGIGPYSANPLDLPTITNTELGLPSGFDYPYGENLDYLTTKAWNRYPSSGEKIWLSNYFVGMHKVDLRTGFYVYERAGFRSKLTFPDCFETQPIGTFTTLDIITGLGLDWNNTSSWTGVNSWESAWEGKDCHLLYGKADVTAEGRFIAGVYGNVPIVDETYEFSLPDSENDEASYRAVDPDPTGILGARTYVFGVGLNQSSITSGRTTVTPYPGRKYGPADDSVIYPGFDRLFAPMHFNYYHMHRRAFYPNTPDNSEEGEWDAMYPELAFPHPISYWGSDYSVFVDAALAQQIMLEHEWSPDYGSLSSVSTFLNGNYIPLQADLNRSYISYSGLSNYKDANYYYPFIHPGWDTFQLRIANSQVSVIASTSAGFTYSGMYGAFGVTNVSHTAILSGTQAADFYSFQVPIALAPMMVEEDIRYIHNPELEEDEPDGYFFLSAV